MQNNAVYNAKMTFMGHYREPTLEVEVPRSAFAKPSFKIKMVYCPFEGKWLSVTGLECGTAVKFTFEKPEAKEKVEEAKSSDTRGRGLMGPTASAPKRATSSNPSAVKR